MMPTEQADRGARVYSAVGLGRELRTSNFLLALMAAAAEINVTRLSLAGSAREAWKFAAAESDARAQAAEQRVGELEAAGKALANAADALGWAANLSGADGDRAPSADALRSGGEDAVGAAERDVGRYIYQRIETLMDAKHVTGIADELTYLATIAEAVEEYGAEACGGEDLSVFQVPPPPAGGVK